MKTKQTRIHTLLFALVFSAAGIATTSNASAESFPFSAAPQAVKPANDNQADVSLAGVELDASNFQFLHGVELSTEQRSFFVQILEKQLPAINSNVSAIETARALLREMALAKHYDATLAEIAADRIAKSTAALAMLQAEREYKTFALLTVEQASVFRN